MRITATINDRQVRQLVRRYRDELSDFRPFFDKEGRKILRDEFAEVFRSEGYGEWAPLAESTLAQKRRMGYPDDILVATGALKRSYLALRGIRRTKFTLSYRPPADVGYAIYHEEGTSRMPARPVFGAVVDDARRQFPTSLRQYISRTGRTPLF